MKTNPSASRWHFCVLSLLLLLVAPVAQATLWTPAYLLSTQLKNWYDASDVTTLWQDTAGTTAVTASGQTVLLWKDKSVNGNHLSISSGGPAYTTGVMNSLPIMRFSGNKLANLAPSMGNSTNNFTVIGVFTVASNNNWDNWLNWGNGTGDLAVYLDGGARTGGSVGSMEFAYNGGTGAYTAASVTAQPAFLFVGGVNQASSPSLFSIWKNGTAETSRNPTGVTAPSTSLTHFLIGPTSGTSQVTHGDIAELIVVNTGTNTLADSDRQYIEGYLANKWWGSGSSNPLPSGHPYKNSAPNVPTYNIVATNGVGGTVSPGGTNGVVQGNNQIYTITPLTGYAINDVLVDGSSVGAVSSYTFTNVQTTHTIGATFTALSLTAPTNLVVASVGDGSVNLTWALSTGSVMAYNVERATTSGGPYTTIASLSSATYYHDITVAVGTNYYYVISATNYATNAISSQASVTPQINPNLWKPSTLGTNLVNWYDAADASTLWQNTAGTTAVTANGQTVLLWQDKSGNGNHLSISSSGPAYTTGVMNSLPVVYFNGNTMANTAVSMGNITNNFTVIGVFQAINDSGGWNNWIIWGNGNVGGGDLDVYLDGGARTTTPAEAMEFAYSGGSGAATTNAVTGQPAFLFIGGVNQATSPSLFSIWMNGGFQQAQNPLYATTPSSSLTQFRIGQSSSSRPHGNIAELIMVNTGTNTLSNADRQNIEGYLANKWWGPGANNLLPSGHPYKNSAPTIPVYGITATNGIGGTLTPTGTNYVLQGNNQTFTIAPLTGYAINDVLVDGSSVGAVSSYTFTNVQTTHTIGATFTALSLTIPTNLVASAGQGTVALTWSAATGPVMAYNVGRATVSGGPYTTVASLVSTSYVDPFVINGTNYFYVVTVTNYAASASTSEASATPQINPNLWKPLGLGSNLVNWYDAADTSTLWQDSGGTTPVTANGNTVLRWNDKSGNGNHLTSSSGPACTTGVMNSLPVLNFAGNTMANLAPNMGNITNNFTVIGVFQVTSDSGWDTWVKWGNGDVGGGDLCAYLDYSARATTPAEAMEFAYDGGTGAATTNAVTGQPAFLFIGGVNQATSPSQFSIWMNGGFQQAQNPTVVTTPCSSLTQFRIGPSTSYQKPHGNLAELIVVNTGTNTLATADRQKIEGYLANKWWGAGTNNPLPSGHPYKNSAPTNGASSVTYGSTTSFVYNGSAQAPTISVAGSTGAITTNYVGTGSTSYSSVNAPTNAGTYYVSNTVASDYNYFGATNSQAFTIGKNSPTVTVPVGSYTYNGSAQGPASIATISPADTGSVTWSYQNSGGTTYGPSSTPPTAAGNYTATATVAADGNNNSASSSATAFTVGKATASVTVTPYAVTYDGNPHTATYETISGVNGETGGTVGTINLSGTTHTSAGTYASDTWSLMGAANYNNIGATTITDTINKATPVVSWSNPADIAYGTALSGTQLNATAGGVAGGYVYTPAGGTVLSVGLGQTLSVQFTPTDTNNYSTPASQTESINVDPVSLTITASAQNKTYGTLLALESSAFTASGLTNGDTVSSVTLASAGATNTATIGSYSITATNAAGSGLTNYSISYGVGTLTVNPLVATLSGTRAYDGTTNAAGTDLAVTNVVNGDVVVLSGTGGLAGADAGTNALSSFGTLSLDSGAGTNYTLAGAAGSMVVTNTPLTITANNDSQTYSGIGYSGGNGVTYAGFVNGETNTALTGGLSYGGSASGATTVGSYNITPGGYSSADYLISYVDGTLTINQAAPVIGTAPTADAIVYGQTLGDSVLSGGAATPSGGSFAFTTPATVPPVGTAAYGVTYTPLDTANYTSATTTVSVTVNPACTAPTIVGGISPAGLTATVGGQAVLTVTNVAGTAPFAYQWLSNSVAITGATYGGFTNLSVTTADAGSYQVIVTNGCGAITSSVAVLTVNAQTPLIASLPTAGAITYGQALSASALTGGSVTNAAGATVAGSFAYTSPDATPNAGTPSAGVTFTPMDTNNYNSATASVSVTVNQALPVVSWSNPADITYGTALGGTQLNATAGGVAGSYAYTPTNGTVLVGGNSQTLSVQFTPTDWVNYSTPAVKTAVINVLLANQTITFGAPGVKTVGDASFALGATASSGLTVSYASSVPTVASVAGGTVTILTAGSTTITASQSGNGNYNAATAVPQVLVVNGLPVLGLHTAGTNAILTWPTNTEAGFSLESAINLNTPSWVSAGAATVIGGQNVVTNPVVPSAKFYHLKK